MHGKEEDAVKKIIKCPEKRLNVREAYFIKFRPKPKYFKMAYYLLKKEERFVR